MKYLSIQTFQCGISVSGLATFTGGAEINVLALNGATTSSEASLFLGAHTTLEGGQLVLQKGTSQTYAAHLDNYSDQFRVMYGTNTGSTGVALGVNLATGQLNLPFYTTTTSFNGTVVGYLAFDSTGKVITTPVPAGGVTSIIAGTGVTVSSSTGNVTVSIGQSVATSATPSFDQVYLTNNGNGTNVKIGDDAWIGDINTSNTFRVMGQQNNANGYIVFGNANTDALGRSGTGNLTYAGSTVWTASTLTNLNQLTNGPGYITAAALAGYVPTSRLITINGVSYDLSADRSWTIATAGYTSKLQHQVKAGVAINKGQAVYVTSADGTNMIVGLASNASEATSSKTMGLLDSTVSTNGFANVVTEGLLAGLDTSTAGAAGDPVWLGTGGNLIYGLINKPYAPAHLVFIGIVTRKNANNGEIFVKVQNGFELDELHDVDLKTNLPTAGQLLRYNSDGLWKNWSPNYLTAEADTLATVTGRGATTNTSITVGPDLTVQSDGGSNYTASRLWLNSHNNYRGAGVHMSGVGSTWFAGTPYTDFDGGYVIARTGTSNDVSSAQYSNALLTVKSSGNVGIGTSNPSYKLQVNADGAGLYVLGANSSPYNQIIASFVYGGNGNSINIENQGGKASIQARAGASTMDLLLNPAGSNVGIGTTTTAFKLNVVDTGATYVAQFKGANSTYVVSGDTLLAGESGFNARNSVGQLFLGIGPSADAYFAGTSGATALNFSLGGTSRLYVNSSGNVGIGTTSPSVKLQVVGDGSFSGFVNANVYNLAGLTGGGALSWTTNTLRLGQDSYFETLQFWTSGTEKMRLTTGGQLIVGGTTVGYAGTKLQVGNTSDSQNGLNILTSTTGYGYILFGDGAGADTYVGQIWYYHADNYMGFQTNGSEKMRITSTGDVGIGTNSPQTGFKLDVNGSTVTRGEIYSNSSIIEFSANGNYKIAQSGNTWLAKTSGNVGIGTSSPNEKLHVAGNIHAYAAGGIDSGLFASTSAGSTTIAIRSNGVTHFNGGNVGIGTNNPKAKFQINNGHIAVYHNVSTDGAQIYLGDTNFDNSGYWNSAPGIGSVFSPGTTVAGDLAFYVYTGVSNSRTERMRITDAGNVGIGTTSPTSKLHVVGETKVTGLAAAYTFFDQANATYYSVWYRNNNITYLYDSYLNSNPFVINSSGNVGIGTTSPGARLTVQTSTASSADSFRITDGTGVINIGHWDTITNRFEFSGKPTYFVQYGTGNYISFGTLGSENMRIVAGGNVGIGTSSPAYKLDVNGIGNFSNGFSNPSSETGYRLKFYDNGGIYNDAGIGLDGSGGGGEIMWFNALGGFYWGLGTSGTKMKLDSSGNLGIGTTSPSQLLHVAGNIRVTGAFYDSNNQAGTSGQILKSTGSGTDWVSLSEITGVDGSGTANYVTKWSDADTITNSLIYDNGTNVGIGTTSPGYNFDVNGQVRVQDKLRVGTVNSGNGVVHMSSSATINPSATTIVWAQNVSVGMCAFIEYYILNNNSLTDQRAGTIMVTWNQSGTPTIAHTETTTPDIGSTIAVNFTSSLVGSDARINAVNSSANPYTIVMSYKYF
jgi:hypothetical protein